jgi:hypothetical protein
VRLILEEDALQDKSVPHICFLVHRFRRSVPGEPTKQLFITPEVWCNSTERGIMDTKSCTIFNVRSVQYRSGPGDCHAQNIRVPCSGYLRDGRRYVVYRVLLYCDDFQPHTSKSDSYGGCNMLPMGILPSERAGYGAVRCIGLTPPGVKTNEFCQIL